jgi:hypothetical protein
MTKKTNPRRDFIQRAFDVFKKAIGEDEPEEESAEEKADGQTGEQKEEKARAKKPSPE